MNDPCIICGQHEAVVEYFDDELFYICEQTQERVSKSELDAECERLEELADEEAVAYGND